MIRSAVFVTLAALVGGCAMNRGGAVPPAPRSAGEALAQAEATSPTLSSARPAGASAGTIGLAELRNAAGQPVGTARVTRSGSDLTIAVSATGLPPGTHGIHLHAVGQCSAPDFASAGGHWNPAMKQHGRDNPAGMHAGDLPNITIGADGTGTLTATIPGAAQGGAGALMDGDGAAVVIHAAADDMRTDPSGNSGARIASGVLQAGI